MYSRQPGRSARATETVPTPRRERPGYRGNFAPRKHRSVLVLLLSWQIAGRTARPMSAGFSTAYSRCPSARVGADQSMCSGASRQSLTGARGPRPAPDLPRRPRAPARADRHRQDAHSRAASFRAALPKYADRVGRISGAPIDAWAVATPGRPGLRRADAVRAETVADTALRAILRLPSGRVLPLNSPRDRDSGYSERLRQIRRGVGVLGFGEARATPRRLAPLPGGQFSAGSVSRFASPAWRAEPVAVGPPPLDSTSHAAKPWAGVVT